MSGLSHTPGKRAKGKTFRGFESRLLRQLISGSFHKKSKSFMLLGFFIVIRSRSDLSTLLVKLTSRVLFQFHPLGWCLT